MSATAETAASPRKPRADAERNRAPTSGCGQAGFRRARAPAASLEEIARAAGVGIGTLYRHFPTRDALVEQVYRDEAGQLAEAAQRLARRCRRWRHCAAGCCCSSTIS